MSNDSLSTKRKKLLERARSANGKKIGEIDIKHRLDRPNNKGAIGQVIQIYLGKDLDNDPEADFKDEKLELKVTGLLPNSKKSSNAFRAKERLVLHDIDYFSDYKETFEESGLLRKCEDMLITCYEYIKAPSGQKPNYKDFPIIDSFIYEIPKQDIEIFIHDYNTIIEKIKNGHAEDISESDTEYLSACTKAADSSVRREQPFSDVPAKPRAFAIKQSYINTIIRRFISNSTFLNAVDAIHRYKENINNNPETLGKYHNSIEQTIKDRLSHWFGKTEDEICNALNIATTSKNRFAVYFSKMLNVKDFKNIEEFQKANIVIKTIRLGKNNLIKENMSFRLIRYKDMIETPWEDSEEREYFSEAKFLFVVFKDTNKGYVFDKVVFYNISDEVVDNFIGYTYKKTRAVLMSGNIVKEVSHQMIKGQDHLIYKTNFVGSKENPICHVRPHAQNSKDTYPLPIRDRVTGFTQYQKECLWLDRRFILAIINGKDKEYIQEAQKKIAK